MLKSPFIAKKLLLSPRRKSKESKPLIYKQKSSRNKHVDVRLFDVFSANVGSTLKPQPITVSRKK